MVPEEVLQDARHRIFGTHIGNNLPSGRKLLRKVLCGEQVANYYMNEIEDPLLVDLERERWGPAAAYSWQVLRVRLGLPGCSCSNCPTGRDVMKGCRVLDIVPHCLWRSEAARQAADAPHCMGPAH